MDELTLNDLNERLDKLEKTICQIENMIFGDPNVDKPGPFSAGRIREVLGMLKQLEAMGQEDEYSLSEKINYYADTYDSLNNKGILFLKPALTELKEKLPKNKRIEQLLERVKKSEKEIISLRSILREFR